MNKQFQKIAPPPEAAGGEGAEAKDPAQLRE
jgi:hypothetical protein